MSKGIGPIWRTRSGLTQGMCKDDVLGLQSGKVKGKSERSFLWP